MRLAMCRTPPEFIRQALSDDPTTQVASMARRYINKFCQFERGGWSCALCTCYNEYTAITDKK